MISRSRKTADAASLVMHKAVKYFGPDGLGLSIHSMDDCFVAFEGGGSHVHVQVEEKNGATRVALQCQKWDEQVRQFLRDLH